MGKFWPNLDPFWTRVRRAGPGPTLDPGTRVPDPGLDALFITNLIAIYKKALAFIIQSLVRET